MGEWGDEKWEIRDEKWEMRDEKSEMRDEGVLSVKFWVKN